LQIENGRASWKTNWSIRERGDKSLFRTTIVMSARGSINEPKSQAGFCKRLGKLQIKVHVGAPPCGFGSACVSGSVATGEDNKGIQEHSSIEKML
jgi:hypothetical protein